MGSLTIASAVYLRIPGVSSGSARPTDSAGSMAAGSSTTGPSTVFRTRRSRRSSRPALACTGLPPAVNWPGCEQMPTPSSELKPVPPDAGSAFRHSPAALPFTVYPLGADPAANQVATLRMDRSGRMWIGTTGGLFVLDQPLGEPRFRRVEPDPSTLRFPHVKAIAEGPDGTLWIGTLSGLFRRLPDGRIVRDRSVPADAEISRLLVDRSGRIWTSSGNGLTLTIPTAPSASSTASPLPGRAPPLSGRFTSFDPAYGAGRSLPIRDDRWIDAHDTEPLRGFRRPRLDRHAGRPDRVRRTGVSCVHRTTWPRERSDQGSRRGSRWQPLDRYRRRRCRSADQKRLRQLQRDGRTQARLRDVDFAEPDRSSPRRRRMGGVERVRWRALHVPLVRLSRSREGGARLRCARGPYGRSVGRHAGRVVAIPGSEPASCSSIAPGRRPPIRW